ncbi:MAG: type I 3-dehydroquinate dehydratase [Clostridiales bacterium 38-18]|nr:MAG: type I 3-dehydroquinate dehydratase [Clostridiales bacterium 38-18]
MVKHAKICIPLMATNIDVLENELEYVISKRPDLVEWRVDRYLATHENWTCEELNEPLKLIRERLSDYDIPMIFTFRGQREGGFLVVSDAVRLNCIYDILNQFRLDYVDIELDLYEHYKDVDEGDTVTSLFKNCVDLARTKGTRLILSHHDFDKTPSFDEMIATIKRGQSLRGDYIKMAYMPHSANEVLKLLAACDYGTNVLNQKMITLSMGERGRISRVISGEFGSEITFVKGFEASAPGQMTIDALKESWESVLMG